MRVNNCNIGLVIIPSSSLKGSGGAERRFLRIFNYHNSCGDSSLKLYLITNKFGYSEFIKAGLLRTSKNVIVFNAQNRNISFEIIYRTLKLYNISVIHIITPMINWLIIWSIPWLKKIFSLTATSPIYTFLNIRKKMIWKFFFIFSNHIDALYPEFLDCFKVYAYKTTISVPFTDLQLFKPVYNKQNIITFVGRLNEEKNPFYLLNALNKLKLQLYRKKWNVYFLGDGPLRASLINFIKYQKLEKFVDIIPTYDTSEYLIKSKIFISIQRWTNYPSQSLLEAMASENAIIATKVGQTHRLIKDGYNGFLVEPEDTNSLSEKILFLMNNNTITSLFGKRSRKIIKQFYTIDKAYEYYVSIWKKVCN